MFYELDSTRVTHKEYWWGTPNPLVVFGWLAKWLRVRLPGSVDDPNVESLQPFRVLPEEFPEEVRAKFVEAHADLAAIGFHSPVCYRVHDAAHRTDIYQAVYVHASGRAFARLHYRAWSMPRPPKEYFFPTFVSCFADGTYLVTTAGKPDMLAPPSCRVRHVTGAAVEALWEAHQERLSQESPTAPVVPVRDEAELVRQVESHHAAVLDFHVRRGVFVPMTADEEGPVMAAALPSEADGEVGPAGEVSPDNAVILAEIERRQNKSSGWLSVVLILGVSVALFVALGATWWSWEFVLLLLPILFFHEAGHYVAMRLFRYRNVRMFFIPLLGAAVSGQHYNVPGWKKVVVSLMGPLPGILLGAVVGVAGAIVGSDLLVDAAALALIVNGFNLLPLIPLDGGWVMHALLFSRHYVLDAAFRVLAVGVMMLGALMLGDPILLFLGIFMALGLPMAFRLVGVVNRLRQRGLPAASPDARSIPPQTADAIIGEVRDSFPQALNNKTLSQLTVQAFEALNARPPGLLATLSLGFVYVGSFLFAMVFLVVLVIARHVGLGDFVAAAASAPQHPVSTASIEVRRGAEAPEIPAAEAEIVATFRKRTAAEDAFGELAGQIPLQARLMRFGQSLVLAVPEEAEDVQEEWIARLRNKTHGIQPSVLFGGCPVTIAAIAPNEDEAVRIEEAARGYLLAPPAMDLVPPWHPDLDITPEQERARRMYAKLVESQNQLDDPALTKFQKEMGEAFARNDQDRARELQRRFNAAYKQAREKAVDKLDRQASDPIEKQVIALYRERPVFEAEETPETPSEADDEAAGPPAESNAGPPARSDAQQEVEEFQLRDAAWARRTGKLLGQMPMEGDAPEPGAARFSSAGGGVTRTGLFIQVSFIRFQHTIDGAPALVRWLAEQKCVGVKYQFLLGF